MLTLIAFAFLLGHLPCAYASNSINSGLLSRTGSTTRESKAKFGLIANTTSTPQDFSSSALLSFDSQGQFAYTLGTQLWQYRAQGLASPHASQVVKAGSVLRLVADDRGVSIACVGSLLNITGCSLQVRSLPDGSVTEEHTLEFDADQNQIAAMVVSHAGNDPHLLATVGRRYTTTHEFRVLEFSMTGKRQRAWVVPTRPKGSVSAVAEVTVHGESLVAWGETELPHESKAGGAAYASSVFVADLASAGNASLTSLRVPSILPDWNPIGPKPQVGLDAPHTSVFYSAACIKCRDPRSPDLLVQYNMSAQQVVASRELPTVAGDPTSTTSLGQAVVSDTHAFVIADVAARNISQGDSVTVFRIPLAEVGNEQVAFEQATVRCMLYNLENRPVALKGSIYFNCIGMDTLDFKTSKNVGVQFGDFV